MSHKSTSRLHLLQCFSVILLIFLTVAGNTYSQTKRGGICFRTDDDQLISRYLEYASIFNKYNQKFTLAINFGYSDLMTPEYLEWLKTNSGKWARDNGSYTNTQDKLFHNNICLQIIT